MRANAVRSRHAAGQPVFNAWLAIGAPYAAEIVAHQGYDAVTVDCQHGMIGFDVALAMLQAISTTPAMPFVRPSGNHAAEIMHWLDAGAYGIICPMISTPEDAAALVSACRYPPVGTRSYGPARGLLYGGADYHERANATITVLAMIETAEGLANLDAIVATPGLDGVYIGPNDLCLALGCPPQSESRDPVAVEAIERIRAATVAQGKIAGIFCSGGAGAAQRLGEGFTFVTPGNDATILKSGAAAALAAARAPAA